jgi:carboxyl-terminal processing protease
MATRARAWLVGCLALLIVLSPLAVSATPLAASERVSGPLMAQLPYGEGGVGSVPSEAGGALRQVYDLLLDNYVSPPQPGLLLVATVGGLRKLAAEKQAGDLPEAKIAESASRDEAFAAFAGWLDLVSPLVAPVIERAALDEMAMRAMAVAISEHHTRYLDARQHSEHEAWRRGEVKYEGIGARLRRPTTVVLEVFEGSPARAAGLRIGDRIVSVDGVPVGEDATDETVSKLRGAPGSSVDVVVERRGAPAPITITIKRAQITLPFVRWDVLERADGRKIGYIQLRGFPEPSVDEKIGQAIADLEVRGIDGLIFDMRGNGGGRIDVGVKVASRFLKDGIIFQQVDRSGRERKVSPVTGQYWERSIPMTALVDGGTASMGEIVGQALQESGAATIVGTTTAGSVAGARLFPLSNGGALQITVLTIISGKGRVLNDAGVIPDIQVELSDDDRVHGVDAQLEAGIKALTPRPAPAKVGLLTFPIRDGWKAAA